MEIKCVWCGKPVEKKQKGQRFCSDECRALEFNTTTEAKRKFRRLAKKYYLEIDIKNMVELTKEKILKFKKQYEKCTKYPQSKTRYCLSEQCLKEISRKGQCACGLFIRKDIWKEKKKEENC